MRSEAGAPLSRLSSAVWCTAVVALLLALCLTPSLPCGGRCVVPHSSFRFPLSRFFSLSFIERRLSNKREVAPQNDTPPFDFGIRDHFFSARSIQHVRPLTHASLSLLVTRTTWEATPERPDRLTCTKVLIVIASFKIYN